MSIYEIEFPQLLQDRYLSVPKTRTPSDGTIAGEVFAVATDLVGGAYNLNTVATPFEPTKDLEVYEALTQILPILSEQSAFFWASAARILASMLATAKYPVRAQASHIVFWWARPGGFMGVTSLAARVGEHENGSTTDGSNIELSWAVPSHTDPSEDSNRRVRFAIDPVHPERRHCLAGGAVLDYLWSAEGSLGLVKSDTGSKEWKDIIEKWLYPDIKNTEQFVEGTTYQKAFDMEPTGEITLKMYYIPPAYPINGEAPKDHASFYRGIDNPEPFRRLPRDLHPSLEALSQMLVDFVNGDGKESKMRASMVACDVISSDKNRLKIYFMSERTTLKDMIYDMTLGGRVTGLRIETAVEKFSKFFHHLFKSSTNTNDEIVLDNLNVQGENEVAFLTRGGVRTIYYYDFFVGEPAPYIKVYFMMDKFSNNDYETAQATEMFPRDVGKPGEEGWMAKDIAHAKYVNETATVSSLT